MERDDIIEYSLEAHHSEEEGRAVRKKIYQVTLVLSVVTIIEVLMGVWWDSLNLPWTLVKLGFIVMTIFKAAGIVLYFMHLGDERKSLKWLILGPYVLFMSYLIFICLTEAVKLYDIRHAFGWL